MFPSFNPQDSPKPTPPQRPWTEHRNEAEASSHAELHGKGTMKT